MNTFEFQGGAEQILSQHKALMNENECLKRELDQLKLFFSELESTNNHLVSATWRERDMKKQLSDTLEELQKTKMLVELQNKRIAESINYARKIQLAINATEKDIRNDLPNSFVYYKAKDVISGDFPWYYRKGNHVFVAAVDCTGHGVPGAMMSMIGNLLLNDIVNDHRVTDPGDVLLRLHNAVVRTLKQDQPESISSDGMDVGLCRIDLTTGELCYSGAHRPLFHLANGKIEQIGGDKFPIGGVQYKGKNNYTNHCFKLNKNESVYLFSDGFPDQIGGPDGKKMLSKGLKQILENNSGREMSDLKHILEKEFDTWMSGHKQIDDVLVIGISF